MKKMRWIAAAVAAASFVLLLAACGTGVEGVEQITGQYYLASNLEGGSLNVRPDDDKQAEQVYQKWVIVPAKDVTVQKVTFLPLLFGEEAVEDLRITAVARNYDGETGEVVTAAIVENFAVVFGEANTLDFGTAVAFAAGAPKGKREECAIELSFTRGGKPNTSVKFKLTKFQLVA